MASATAHNPFAPPHTPGFLRALGLALLAHSALVVVLTIGVQWRHEAPLVTSEAELWATVPEQAAPPEVMPPEPPPPEQTQKVDIAIAKEKERLQKEKQLEREKLERDKLEQEKLKADKLNKDKNKDKAAQALEAKKLEETRRKNIERMTALAGSGPEGSSGSAAQSKGPSAGYAGRINQLIKLNTKYSSTDVVNPSVKVLLRVEASGAIYESTVISSSGNAAWNDAVVRAIDRMGLIPKDIDGKIPNEIVKSGLELTVTR